MVPSCPSEEAMPPRACRMTLSRSGLETGSSPRPFSSCASLSVSENNAPKSAGRMVFPLTEISFRRATVSVPVWAVKSPPTFRVPP